jgi:3-oxoacyl-[acyl-carrier-protein] synthase II
MNREIVVTGVGAVTPLGVGSRTLYERWKAGESGIADGVGAATDFDPTDYLTVKQARRSDRFSQFAMVASDEALAEAGWKDELPYDADRVATLIGTGIGGIGTLEVNHKKLLESGPRPFRRSRSRC